jgi:NRPS condensation-like uncharacterized protein
MGTENLILMDPISEAHMYFKHPNYSETSYVVLTLKGNFDNEVFKQAYKDFMLKYPIFRSILVEKKIGLFYHLYRNPKDKFPEVQEVDLRNSTLPNREKVLNYFSEMVMHNFDLFREVALHAYICDLGNNYTALVFMSHHILVDGHGVATFLMDFFLIYYEKLFKKKLPLDGVLGLFSSRRTSIEPKRSGFSLLKTLFSSRSLGLVIKLFALNRAKHFKLKYPKSKERHMKRVVFQKDVQEKLRKVAKSKGASLNDLLVALLFKSLDSMFFVKKKDKKLFTISAPVNLFGKLEEDKRRANNITSIVYGSYGSHRKNIDSLLKLVRETTNRQINSKIDIIQYNYLRLLVKFTQLFPYRLRFKLFKNVFQQASTSMLSNLGILWPELKNGRPTGRSLVSKISKDLELVDLDFNYPGIPRLGHGLASYTYQEKLFIILTFSGAFFSEAEVSKFISALKNEVNSIIQLNDS